MRYFTFILSFKWHGLFSYCFKHYHGSKVDFLKSLKHIGSRKFVPVFLRNGSFDWGWNFAHHWAWWLWGPLPSIKFGGSKSFNLFLICSYSNFRTFSLVLVIFLLLYRASLWKFNQYNKVKCYIWKIYSGMPKVLNVGLLSLVSPLSGES